jgi:membrane-associated protein
VVEAFLDWVARLPGVAVYGVLAVLSAVENVFPPVPADVAVVLGGFLAHRGVTTAWLLGVLCWLANTLTSAAMYFYARSRGPRMFEAGWPRRLMPPESLAALGRAYARHGMLGIFLSRFLPGVRAAVTPFAGVVGMGPWRALGPAFAASALWYGFLVTVGSALGYNWQRARAIVDDTSRGLGLLALGVTAAFAWWLWRRRRLTGEGSD